MSLVTVKTTLSAAAAVAVLGLAQANAGIVSFNIANDDATSGISAAKTYTAKSNFGSNSVAVNGVTFDPVALSGGVNGPNSVLTAPGITAVSIAVAPPPPGNGSEWKSDAQNIGNFGTSNLTVSDFRTLVTQFRYSSGNNTTVSQVYTLSDLVAGQEYDLRVYGRRWGNDTRNVSLDFTGDGSTQNYSFNEDGNPNGWYISHVFTYDGTSNPGFTATSNFHIYGLSNEVVIPEPATLGLLGVAGLLVGRRRKA